MKKLLAMLLLFTCTSKEKSSGCKVDSRFTAKFYNCLTILAVREAGVYTHEDTYDAYNCLTSLTSVKSYMYGTLLAYEYSDTINYFCLDLQAWLKWYESSKCGYTLEKADITLRQDSVKWPRDLNEFYLEDMGCIIHELK